MALENFYLLAESQGVMKTHFFGVLLLLSLIASRPAFSASPPNQDIRFNRDIRPILAETCFQCHGADPASRKGKLRLDEESGFFKDRQEGPTVVRGNPEKSPLYKRLLSTDPEEMMPPPKSHKVLKPEEKEKIKRWIAQGAKWEAHWSFIKPARSEAPKVKTDKWVANPIDSYVLAKLDATGLKPAPEADRRTIARRLSLDLTGLPPEPEVVETFVAEKAPNAYEQLVDRMLASPRYGEHRGRYWLDAARYGDTHGLHFDNFREVWPFRDWVINAFNRNLPFDQFTVEQLAGDLLPNPTKDQIIATGFHRCNITTNEGGSINDEVLASYARDRAETTSWVWLGLTANCAVCHDHKFDPITTKDFYSMTAYFRNTTQGAMDGNVRDTAPVMVVAKPEDEARLKAIPADVDAAKAVVAEQKKALRAGFDKWLESAKPEDWDATVQKIGAPDFQMLLNEEKPGDQIPATYKGAAIMAKAVKPIQWADGGKVGKAPVFGDLTPLEISGNVGDLDKGDKFSFGAWIKTPKDFKGSAAAFAKMDEADKYRGWDLWLQESEFGVHFVNKWEEDAVKVVTTGNQIKKGTWQHVFVTYDGSLKSSGFKIYVDGKEAKLNVEKDTLKSTTKTTTPLLIGQRKSSSPFNGGSVQDVRIYNRKLSASEVFRLGAQEKMKGVLAKAAKDRTSKEKDELFDGYSGDNTELAAANDKIAALEVEKKTIRDRSYVAHIMEEKKGSSPMANILIRGDYSKPGDKVEAGIFTFLHALPANAPKNRLGLAQWLVAPENPLMARVIVNRLWQEIFGTGIVKTAEDLGIMGDAPSNQELLDYLSVEFREGGWDVKKLIKQIVMSSTYRQSPLTDKIKIEKDPADRLFSRGARFRMDAEMIRDYALSAAGLLSAKLGGPSVKPYQPENVWEVVGMPGSDTRNYTRDNGDALYRRSMYTFWKRASPPASMDILNAPSRETSCVRRERTNTPLQALVTLNDPQFVEAARVLAQNAMKSGADDAKRMDFIARRVLSRPLNEKETPVLQKIQQDLLAHYKAKADDVKALLAVGETKLDATLNAPELAAWTMVCNQLFNLDEVLNK